MVELSLELDESSELDVDESLVLDDDELELDGEGELEDGEDVELADHDLNSVSLRYPSPFPSAVRNPLLRWLFDCASVADTRPSPFVSIPLKSFIPLGLAALELALLVVSSAEANAAALVSTRPNMSCLIISITL